jgi:hypothetical protein
MNGHIRFTAEEGLFEFSGEESFAALLLERPARLTVTRRGEDADFGRTMERFAKPSRSIVGLLEG